MLRGTRLPLRHWRVPMTPTSTLVSTRLLRMVSTDTRINKTAKKLTGEPTTIVTMVNKLSQSSSSKSSKRSGRK
jgi:hypothetical protein